MSQRSTNPFDSPVGSFGADDSHHGHEHRNRLESESTLTVESRYHDCHSQDDDGSQARPHDPIEELRVEPSIPFRAFEDLPPVVFSADGGSIGPRDANTRVQNGLRESFGNRVDFVSPLESALMRGYESSPQSAGNEGDDEMIPLISGLSSSKLWSLIVDTISPRHSSGRLRHRVGSEDESYRTAKSNASSSGETCNAQTELDGVINFVDEVEIRQQKATASVHFSEEKYPKTSPSLMQRSLSDDSLTTPLRSNCLDGGYLPRRSLRRKKSGGFHGVQASRANLVLEDIGAESENAFSFDNNAAGKPWKKVIKLEDLGTASSWFVLLIPYVAFLIALVLDSTSILQDETVGPLSGDAICEDARNNAPASTFPLTPISQVPCSYPYAIHEDEGMLINVNAKNAIVDRKFEFFMGQGIALSSGPVQNVPAMSTFLWGDINFSKLSNDAVALVTNGSVLVSTAVFQRKTEGGEVSYDERTKTSRSKKHEWIPVSVSKPERLEMVCSYVKTDNLWNCTAPRIIDILFSLPETGVLTGSDIRVETLFSYYAPQPSDVWNRQLQQQEHQLQQEQQQQLQAVSHPDEEKHHRHHHPKKTAEDRAKDILSSSDHSNPKRSLYEISLSGSYIFNHQRQSYAKLISVVRLLALAVSFSFAVYWARKMGLSGFFSDKRNSTEHPAAISGVNGGVYSFPFGRWSRSAEEEPIRKQLQGLSWWESPWIICPERRYLLVLLLCLFMIQNPLLAVAYYRPVLYGSASMHVAADSLIGVGVHGILMMTTCLMQGLRYHTASFNRRRAKQKRMALELSEAALYLAKEGHPSYGANSPASSYAASYYEVYGDVEGSSFAGGMNSRLRHDPCGDEWLDFLLPKLVLFGAGSMAVIASALSRFPGPADSNEPTIKRDSMDLYKAIYVASSFMQFFVLVSWCYLIMKSTIITAERLKREPFLSTRPAQLAFRVFTGILFLGFMAIFLPMVLDILVLLIKYDADRDKPATNSDESIAVYHTSSGYYAMEKEPSLLETLVKIVVRTTSRFPYSGTASSIGPGKIIYATVCSLVSAFIFLPASPTNDHVEEERIGNKTLVEIDKDLQRNDKRQVVTLARFTHSWRVFPLPIQQSAVLKFQAVPSKIMPPEAFEISSNCSPRAASFKRGVAYKGRYMPVFCIEIACWLLEAAWQAYYSHDEFKTDDWAPGRMSLESVGLKLEAAIEDDQHDTKAYVCSNFKPQVDGEADSIIVVAFRGTASTQNMKVDLKWQQVPLPRELHSVDGRAAYQVQIGGIDQNGDPIGDSESPYVSLLSPRRLDGKRNIFAPNEMIKATPIVRQALPCIHEGFLEAYTRIREEVLEKVLEVFQRQIEESVHRIRGNNCREGSSILSSNLQIPKIYITGHSMGGALGQLLALDLACNCDILIEEMEQQISPPRNDNIFGKTKPVHHIHKTNESNRRERMRSVRNGGVSFMRRSSSYTTQESETPRLNRDNFVSRRRRAMSDAGGVSDESPIDFFKALLSGDSHRRRRKKTLRLQPPIAVYTFGQPRLGNRAFAKLYKQRVPHTFRVVNEGDAFTSLPIATCLGGLYKHAGLEVLLDEGCTGNILVGPTIVETMFRFTKVRTSFAAHQMERYRDGLESAISDNELQEYYRGHGGKVGQDSGVNENHARQNLPEWVTQVRRSIKE